MANGNGKNGKQKPGRKAVVLTQRQIDQVELMAAELSTEAHIARVVADVAARTWYDLKQRDARIAAALERGHADAESGVWKALYARAIKGDNTAAIWILKARFGHWEKQTVQHGATDDQPVSFSLTIGDGHHDG